MRNDCAIFLFPFLDPLIIVFLSWGQKEMFLPKLHKGTHSSNEQANTMPKQKELTEDTGEFPD